MNFHILLWIRGNAEDKEVIGFIQSTEYDIRSMLQYIADKKEIKRKDYDTFFFDFIYRVRNLKQAVKFLQGDIKYTVEIDKVVHNNKELKEEKQDEKTKAFCDLQEAESKFFKNNSERLKINLKLMTCNDEQEKKELEKQMQELVEEAQKLDYDYMKKKMAYDKIHKKK